MFDAGSILDSGARADLLKAFHDVLARDERLRWAYVFGSLAGGGPFRDADIAVMAAAGTFRTIRDLGRLARALSQASGIDGLIVDLFDILDCPAQMVEEILSQGLVVLDREPAERRLWEAEATLEWLDFKHVWELPREFPGSSAG